MSGMGTLFDLTSMSKWRASAILKLRLSPERKQPARKAGTDWPDCVSGWDARVTIIQDDGYWRFQTEVELNVAYRCSNCLLSCRDSSMLIVCLCRPTVTLHQGQGHRHEHEHICHAYIFLHAKGDCHSLNIVRDITIILQVKRVSSMGRTRGLELRLRSSDWEKNI